MKTPSRLMYWFPIFGDNDVIILPQNGYMLNVLKNGAYDFLYYAERYVRGIWERLGELAFSV